MSSRSYSPLRDYGVIGDRRTAALVSRRGSVDWWCLPRFDSPSVFGRMLDDRTGGFCSLAPAGAIRGSPVWESAQRYADGTNVLHTEFESADAGLRLTDFMPLRVGGRSPGEASGSGLAAGRDPRPELHRRVEAVGGPVEAELRLAPRFDYARRSPGFRERRHGFLATDRSTDVLTVSCDRDVPLEVDGRRSEVRARFRVEPGEPRWIVLRWDDDEVHPVDSYRSEEKLERTAALWREWAEGVRYRGEYRDLVRRSALVLKLLTYGPTGAIVAAPTTSLPETPGGGRNWDYRYAWLRDGVYSLFALDAVGKGEEIDRFVEYLKRLMRREERDGLQVVYGIGGEAGLPNEEELDHLHGYRGSRPVRIGNEASGQVQLDVYGEVMDAVRIWRRRNRMSEGTWELVNHVADEAADRWTQRDQGPWEVRTPPRHFVFSKVMCWVALDRALRAAEEVDRPAPVDRWRAARDRIRQAVLDDGWSPRRRAFRQHFETDRTDAANLQLAILGFLPADDDRILDTVDAIRDELLHPSGPVYRYRNRDGDFSPFDGMDEEEAPFSLTGFNLAQVLALAGRREEAVEQFEAVADFASPLGLLSEQVDPEAGQLLGNYPQALSHAALVNAAHVLARTREGSEAGGRALPGAARSRHARGE